MNSELPNQMKILINFNAFSIHCLTCK